MGSLHYSRGALSALRKFHRKKHVVFVEGFEDVRFWHTIFSQFGIEDAVFKPAGGYTELEFYIDAIIEQNADIIVARDCDYTDLLESQVAHPRVLYTYGYSIENTIFSPDHIALFAMNYTAQMEPDIQRVQLWLDAFVESSSNLLAYDLANILFNKGLRVMGDNCGRFLMERKSFQIDRDKVKDFMIKHCGSITESEYATAHYLIDQSSKHSRYHIRGHFLILAIVNYIRHRVQTLFGRNTTISLENFFSSE